MRERMASLTSHSSSPAPQEPLVADEPALEPLPNAPALTLPDSQPASQALLVQQKEEEKEPIDLESFDAEMLGYRRKFRRLPGFASGVAAVKAEPKPEPEADMSQNPINLAVVRRVTIQRSPLLIMSQAN